MFRYWLRSIFEIVPQALALYTFGGDFSDQETLTSSDQILDQVFELPGFALHATAVVQMLEMVLTTMCGDDVSPLGEALGSLGARHVSYGVLSAHYGVLETALLRTLEAALTSHGLWTPDVRKGWAAVMKFTAKAMQEGAVSEIEIEKVKREDTEREKHATLRMRVIRRSEGTSNLKRSGMGTRFKSTIAGQGTSPSLVSSSVGPKQKSNLPPVMPRRSREF